ncbi:MAG: hypothetical protein J7K21_01395 [Desulfurococcales archaeon]|nr:hypothetical protein [Desulfurococcales archaeon]
MTKGDELAKEALSVLNTFMSRIENNALAKVATLKPQVVSIAQRFMELGNLLSRIFNSSLKKLGELEQGRSLYIHPWWSLSVYGDRTVITRHKPFTISFTYISSENKIVVKTKRYKAELSGAHVVLRKLGYKIELDPGDPGELNNKVNDIKYLLKEIFYPIEQAVLIAEKKFT